MPKSKLLTRGLTKAAEKGGGQVEEEQVEDEEEMVVGTHEETTGREPTLGDLAGMMQALMGRQQKQEAERKADLVRQENKFKILQQQFQLLQDEVQGQSSPGDGPTTPKPEPADMEASPSRANTSHLEDDSVFYMLPGQSRFSHEPKMEKLSTEDDIEHYLITFERIATVCRWPKTDWVFRLIPLLTGKARAAYVHMDMEDALDYKKVKAAILQKYDINAETYRQRFRSLDVETGESPKELYVRLKELYGKWTSPKGKIGRAHV